MDDKLLLSKEGQIAWIVFNQPAKRNAVSQAMWARMPEYVDDLANDDDIRVVILRGAGDQAFVAGADISEFKDRRRNMADEEAFARVSTRGTEALAGLSKPLLAMIHGYCVGGGVSIAITCDIRIAADDARFGIPAARLGLGYPHDGMEKLMKLVGPAYTKEICAFPSVEEAAVIAARSELSEDEVMAVVAPVPEQSIDPLELARFLKDRLPYFMVPRYIRVLPELPKTPTAKIQKTTLREEGVTDDTWDREAEGTLVIKRERLDSTPSDRAR